MVGKWLISDMSRSRAVLGLLGVSGFCVRLSGERRSLCENQRDKDKDKEKDGESSESEGVLARAWQVIAEVFITSRRSALLGVGPRHLCTMSSKVVLLER